MTPSHYSSNVLDALADTIAPELVLFDEPMSLHTSFCVGGPADLFLSPRSYEELLLCLQFTRRYALPCFLLGGGTNILVSDRGIRGVVLYTGKLNCITVEDNVLTVQAGAQVEDVCLAAAQNSLQGLEFIHGMPGSIGGAVWMNARCYDGSMADVLVKVEVLGDDMSLSTVQCDPRHFGYKHSPFQAMPGCIWQVTLRLQHGEQKVIYERMEKNKNDRMSKGHFDAPSAGSLFKNNREFGAPTGKIIDELGLRGKEIGGAAIAPFHGNIFINQDNATAADVLALIRLAMETAAHVRNIRLEPEVRMVGDWLAEELAFLDPAFEFNLRK